MDTCKFCRHVREVFENPYHYSGAIIARLAVSFATIIWSVVVLFKQDALIRWPGSNIINNFIGENTFAGAMLFLALVAIYRLIYHAKPVKIDSCIYFLMALLWVYTFASLAMAIYYGETTLRPGQLSAILAVTVLSLFAFIANPKSQRG